LNRRADGFGSGGDRQDGAPEPGGEEADDTRVGAERLGHHVGPRRPQPVLKEPVRQQIRRDDDAA
jgi:hypothetical protein